MTRLPSAGQERAMPTACGRGATLALGRSIGPCALALVSAACATGPEFDGPAPALTDKATLYLFRPAGLFGAGVTHAVAVDGAGRGRLLNGSYLVVELAGPDRFVDLQVQGCRRLMKPLLVRPGQTAYVRVQLTHKTAELGGKHYFDFGCELAQINADEALRAMSGLRRAGP
jgi:hypothetical protein